MMRLSHFNTETNQGVYHTYQEISYRLAQASAAPIFVLWEFYIRDGIVGGYVNRSEQLGKDILMALNQFVSLDLASTVDMQISSTRAVFDYQAMQRHQIDMKALPQDVLVLNRPLSYFEQHWKVLLTASFIILCLLVVIVMQGVTLRQKRELGVKNRKIVVLQERTLAVQREMIHLLGEAIETRSGETGNHVKRVARLSALLARLCGLTQREVEMIEIISPMHDVGKIAIPESILDKPGKLTPDEWEIMQTHTTAGYNILNTSEGDITKLAAIVAHEHHERWDGKGYPNQKKAQTFIYLLALLR
ncbi:HD-GYP domain-containing protein [Vibrio anguillarum]|uniref:HD-GYP domain-containing protein n=1 Tax=Vibrio anguillarum TaxID=55601 RepID=UPI003CF95308